VLDSIVFYALTHFAGLWNLVQKVPFLRRWINATLINSDILKLRPRPSALSTMAPYTSWASLTDRTYSSRHLPPVPRAPGSLPPVNDVVELFRRAKGAMKPAPKSTVLFPCFAQWFTDGFLRTDYQNPLKNTSNHDIDLSNLYGLNKGQTDILRAHVDGKLKYQMINNEMYPASYYENGQAKPEFVNLNMTALLPRFEQELGRSPVDPLLFAMGGDRVNSHVGFSAMNVLFLREHNRICDVLKQKEKITDDTQLFETARNILIVMLIKIVIGEYINHIAPYNFKFFLQPAGFEDQRWYRQNWMAVEFNLLYRWHGLVPDSYRIGEKDWTLEQTLFRNQLLVDRGLGGLLADFSAQPAGQLGLFNVPESLLPVEEMSIKLGRLAELASYNDYRELCGMGRAKSFDEITSNKEIQAALKRVYREVDNVEYYPGIFAEEIRSNSALPALIGRIVGIDAFSQALTNPLASRNIYHERTFTPTGLNVLDSTERLEDILNRNLPAGSPTYHLTMDR
jgi:prostaglandin-endoperoxide synthase 2